MAHEEADLYEASRVYPEKACLGERDSIGHRDLNTVATDKGETPDLSKAMATSSTHAAGLGLIATP